MYYGGKLLSHLTAEDPEGQENQEIEEFISLRKLNRKIAIIMDSDKKSGTEEINSSKKRIKLEFEKGPGHAWVTNGREIENYLPEKPFIEAVKKVHPKSNIQSLIDKGRYGCRVKIEQSSSNKACRILKVKVAKEFVNQEGNIDFLKLDLGSQVDKLIQFIDSSNN